MACADGADGLNQLHSQVSPTQKKNVNKLLLHCNKYLVHALAHYFTVHRCVEDTFLLILECALEASDKLCRFGTHEVVQYSVMRSGCWQGPSNIVA